MTRLRWLTFAAILLGSPVARAQSGSDVAAAQALFDEGKRLMQEKRFEDACPKLVESQRLDPGGGTLLAIALCHEGQGKLATAWGDFSLAASEARRDRRADRESAASGHARALEPRLTRARIVVAATVDGLEVLRDGKGVGSAEWGMAMPIDAGDHVFEARAPGKTSWHGTITLAGEGKTVDVSIPALADEPKPAPPPPPVVAAVPPPAATPPPASAAAAQPELPPPPAKDGSTLRTVGYVTGGVSLAVVAVGAGFGAAAMSNWHNAQNACPGNTCKNASDAELGASAGRTADVSTVFFAVGGVGLAASLAMVLLAPSSSPSGGARALRISPLVGSANGIVVGGDL